MYQQPKFLPDQENHFFPAMNANRAPVAHTVPRGPVADSSSYYTGQEGAGLTNTFPISITPEVVARGREAFEINCSACHGRDGYGQGMVVQRGFPRPPSFHSDRLRAASVGHYFDVITRGYGAMYPFASRVSPADRWAIIAYIRALQFSQHAPASQLPRQDEMQLEDAR